MNQIFLLFLLVASCSSRSPDFALIVREPEKPRSPVIYVPGDGGSQMDAQLDKPEVVHYICTKKTKDWFNIWLNLELLLPGVIDCWIDNVKLNYDNVTRTTFNQPGVELRVPGWGSSEVVEYIDPSHISTGYYFKYISDALVSTGYVRNVSLRGAPYDFRKAPNENKQWFVDLKTLVEETYEMNGQVPVTFIAHSMGAPMTRVFLGQQSADWKKKYVARLVSLAGAWGGSAKAMKVFAIGDDLGALALRGSVMREEQITMPSLAWLLPSPYFWKKDEVLVKTTKREYTLADLEDFFTDLDYYTGWEMRKDTEKYLDFAPPGVELHCIFGSKVPTVEMLDYPSPDLTGKPKLHMGDGDGTVNIRSLRGCQLWRQMQKPEITTLEVPKAEHMLVLQAPEVLQYIVNLLTQ